MRVIKEGQPWGKEVECTGKGNGNCGCGATLLIQEGDLFYTYSHTKDETDRFISFRCPCCGGLTDVTGIPTRITIKEKE